MRAKMALLATALLAALNFGFVVRAQEGAPHLDNAPLGPYRISVWTEPQPARVGALHVRATLTSTERDEGVTAPEITAYARALHTDVFEQKMTPDASFYTADFDIPYAGPWTIELRVRDGDGADSVSFPLEVQPAPIDKNMIRLAAFLTLAFLGVGWWFWGRKPRKKRVRKRIFMPRPDEE